MKEIEFVKAVASGNDFVIIDRFRQRTNEPTNQRTNELAKELCQRKLSVGADGLLLIEPSEKCDFKMRVFNPDGSEVDMCGNGSRCVALYAAQERICGNKMVIETNAGNLTAEVRKDDVKIKMPNPKDLRLKFDININGQTKNLNFINTGVPHVVCFVQGLNNFDVHNTGRAIRYHPEFQPQGANANFVEVLDNDHLRLRTYERGVEEETLSCGTGAVAAGIISAYQVDHPSAHPRGVHKVKVDTQGGETLTVHFNIKKENIDEVYLEGKARLVYKGKMSGK